MAFTISDFLRTRAHVLRQPSPVLEFWELSLPDGGFFRVVDFADKDAGGSLPDKVPFNGVEFQAMPVTRGKIEESSEGTDFQLPIAIHDPLGAAAAYLRQWSGLDGQTVKWWLTTYDRLSVPADAYQEIFEVIQSYVTQDPNTVTLVLGHPNLYESRYPKLLYLRDKCFNPYQDRFTPGNLCTYPSNEFDGQTRQHILPTASYEEQVQRHGWRTQQARRASKFDVDVSASGKLSIASTEKRIAWKGRERYGPYFYRPIAGDLDIETVLSIPATTRTKWIAGLLCQEPVPAQAVADGEDPPASPTSSWILFGAQDDGAGSRRLVNRVTTANISTADATVASTDLYLRLARVGNLFTLYSKATAAAAWTQRFQMTLLLPATVNIGLVIASDERSTAAFECQFDYLRFLAGGLSSCRRDRPDCIAHENLIQFNGFNEMPKDRLRA